MELTDTEAQLVKYLYDAYESGRINAEEALISLEQLINGDTEEDN